MMQKKETSLEFVSKKTEGLDEPLPLVDVTDNNVDVRDTVDTVHSVDSGLFGRVAQLGVQSSLGHQGPLFLGSAQREGWEEGRKFVPADNRVPLESFKVQHTVRVVVVEQDKPRTDEIHVKLCQVLVFWDGH